MDRSIVWGFALHDLRNPAKVIGVATRGLCSRKSLEITGYVHNVVFTCGAVAESDGTVKIYWGAPTRSCAWAKRMSRIWWPYAGSRQTSQVGSRVRRANVWPRYLNGPVTPPLRWRCSGRVAASALVCPTAPGQPHRSRAHGTCMAARRDGALPPGAAYATRLGACTVAGAGGGAGLPRPRAVQSATAGKAEA